MREQLREQTRISKADIQAVRKALAGTAERDLDKFDVGGRFRNELQCNEDVMQDTYKARIGKKGRIVLPLDWRKAVHTGPGDELVIYWRFAILTLYEDCMRSATWNQIEMGHYSLRAPSVFFDMVDGPSHGRTQRLSQHCSTGFADRPQLLVCPVIRMALPQLFHQQTVRYHDQVHMPRLALAVA